MKEFYCIVLVAIKHIWICLIHFNVTEVCYIQLLALKSYYCRGTPKHLIRISLVFSMTIGDLLSAFSGSGDILVESAGSFISLTSSLYNNCTDRIRTLPLRNFHWNRMCLWTGSVWECAPPLLSLQGNVNVPSSGAAVMSLVRSTVVHSALDLHISVSMSACVPREGPLLWPTCPPDTSPQHTRVCMF